MGLRGLRRMPEALLTAGALKVGKAGATPPFASTHASIPRTWRGWKFPRRHDRHRTAPPACMPGAENCTLGWRTPRVTSKDKGEPAKAIPTGPGAGRGFLPIPQKGIVGVRAEATPPGMRKRRHFPVSDLRQLAQRGIARPLCLLWSDQESPFHETLFSERLRRYDLEEQLETRVAEVNRRMATGENRHFKLKPGGIRMDTRIPERQRSGSPGSLTSNYIFLRG
jgi:hypothetical protein